MNLARLVEEAGVRAGGRVAVYRGSAPLFDYRTLALRVRRIAGFLQGRGVKPGDRVGLFMPNHVSYLEVLYGAMHAGAAVVPVNAKLHASELAYILEESDARVCFVSEGSAPTAASAAGAVTGPCALVSVDGADFAQVLRADEVPLAARAGDDLAWLFFTSGTTGQPKGAMLSHNNLFLMTSSYLTEVHPLTPEHRLLHAAPMSHGSGMYNFAHVARAAAQIVPESAGFDSREIADITAVLSGVSMFAAPTMVGRLLRETDSARGDLRGLELVVYGGGPMLLEQIRAAVRQLGSRFAQIYGQGECPMTITRLGREFHGGDTDDSALSSVGTPFHLVDVRIGDSERPLPAGEAGEILVRSPIVMQGYWSRDPARRSPAPEWLPTGDVGYLDARGFLHLTDRSKDVIISGGSNIYSREVEDVLASHPAVLEVAVVGAPSVEWGEEVVAVIGHGQLPPPREEDLDELCTSRIARFKRPKHYVFQSDLPKNAYGKIEKRALKEHVSRILSPLSKQQG